MYDVSPPFGTIYFLFSLQRLRKRRTDRQTKRLLWKIEGQKTEKKWKIPRHLFFPTPIERDLRARSDCLQMNPFSNILLLAFLDASPPFVLNLFFFLYILSSLIFALSPLFIHCFTYILCIKNSIAHVKEEARVEKALLINGTVLTISNLKRSNYNGNNIHDHDLSHGSVVTCQS